MKKIILIGLLIIPVQGIAQQEDADQIKKLAKKFSETYVSGDIDALTNMYTFDGKMFPGGKDIVEGRKAIKEQWTMKEGWKVLEHKLEVLELKILGDHAYDYGYYSVVNQKPDGTKVSFKGKYVVVWRRNPNEGWQIYLDIWNRNE